MSDPSELIKQATTISEAATPGPWGPIDDYDGVAAHHGWRGLSCPSGNGGHGGDGLVFATHEWDVGLKEVDIEFIATARTLVPELAKALKELDVERRRLNGGWRRANFRMLELMGHMADEEGEIDMEKKVAELIRERDEAQELLRGLQGRHQIASIAVASGLNPDATLDELYEHLAELRDA